jgi:hypothetical protein
MSTTIVYGDTVEGTLSGQDAVYATARSTYNFSGASLLVGQYGAYVVNEGFVRFDTSFVGTDNITSAVLSFYVTNDSSVTDFVFEARLHPWGTTYESADWVAGASLSGLTLLASINTSALTPSAYNDLADVALPANINKTGFTNFLLSSSRQRVGNVPTTDEYVGVQDKATGGTSTGPKLTVVYSAGGQAPGDEDGYLPRAMPQEPQIVTVFS